MGLLPCLLLWLLLLSPTPAAAAAAPHLCVQALHLLPDVVNDRLQRGAVGGLRLLVQVVDVQVVRDGHLAAGQGLQDDTHKAARKLLVNTATVRRQQQTIACLSSDIREAATQRAEQTPGLRCALRG